MVRLREIPRTAAFAWSPGADAPSIATGTKAGALDADFSNESLLELWDLNLNDTTQGVELQPAGSISTDSRFHDIAWSQANEDHPRGVIAGALENGSLDLWDAEKLRSASGDSFLSRTTKHTGAVKSLQFNPHRHGLLASAGAKAELFIYDMNNVGNPARLGAAGARAEDYETLDWNKQVAHILAAGSSGGYVTVWDVKAKKESLTLNNNGRKAVSAVAWDPDVATKLITAVPSDQDPLILMWDLRNANAPERILKGHELGILSLSWCIQDPSLLLSCGKDNRTICWNPRTGEQYGEFPVVNNWTFQTRWNPHNPNFLATASFDNKITVQTIQNTSQDPSQASQAAAQNLNDADFFAQVQSQPQGIDFTLSHTPRWLERPVSVSFGFGGKLVKLGPADAKSRKSKITLSTFAVDSAISDATEKFEQTLKGGDLASICESKKSAAKTDEEKADWNVIETLISDNPRKALVGYLGFADTVDDLAAKTSTLDIGENGDKEASSVNGTDDASFFDKAEGDSFLSDLAATKVAKTNNPFQIYTGSETGSDKEITEALMLGSFEKALDVCLKEGRMSDAFMIAICGGQKCIDKAQAAYFKKQSGGPNYLRLLASIVGKNLWDIVHNADLKDWKSVMATVCTFAEGVEFADLCEGLGDRLMDSIADSNDPNTRKDASFCYLAGSKLEKVVLIWLDELQENEKEGIQHEEGDSTFSVHAKLLQDFIEKVTVFRQVTKFEDPDRKESSGWRLSPLYARYTEYADILAAHGQLQIAEKYLDLLPAEYSAGEVARNRVKQATKKAASQPAARQAAPATRTTQRVAPAAPYQPVQNTLPTPGPALATAPSPYAPPNPLAPATQPGNAPGATRGGYVPAGYQPPTSQYSAPQPSYGGGYQPPSAIPPPPRMSTASPSVPPPSKTGNMSNWNDTPDFGPKPPTSRRGTPAIVGPSAISSPFPGGPSAIPPPTGAAAAFAQPPPPAAVPPPPKAGQGPPRVSSPFTSASLHIERPPSAASNAYVPQRSPSQTLPPPQPPMVPRGASPFSPPPSSTAPTSNRYAPAPSAQPSQQQVPPSMGGPPMGGRAPPPNPYASRQDSYAPQPNNQYGAPPPQSVVAPPPQGPPQGPPRAAPPPSSQGAPLAPPPGGPPRAAAPESRPSTAQSQRTSTPAAAKYPPGDRSRIPASAEPIYSILSSDLQRVKARAPSNFKAHVADVEKRLNILFDHLNNEDLLKPDTIQQMVELSQMMQGHDYDNAAMLLTDMMKTKMDEGTNWMVGVKRLIAMSKATPR